MRALALACLLSLIAVEGIAAPEAFSTGPVIAAFGPAAVVNGAEPIPEDQTFEVAFDTAEDSEGLNRTLVSAARFLNMHGKAGVDPSQINLAIIVHGSAIMDILSDVAHESRKDGASNPNTPLVAALQAHNVRIILCGQTAAYRNIVQDELLPGIEISLSAMTAHAQLQQSGYTLNPF